MSDSTAPRPVWLWWSTGKDSAWSLHVLNQRSDRVVEKLISTVTPTFSRVAVHGTRLSVLEMQAQSTGVPLETIELSYPSSNEDYESAIRPMLEAAASHGAIMAFGDLFLEDIRAYRLGLLEPFGVTAEFPIWGLDTEQLAHDMVASGLEARVTTLDPSRLDPSLAGATFDAAFLRGLPEDVDSCGENGEFHTCVTAGPMFETPIAVTTGEIVEREGFVYADIVPASDPDAG